MKCVRLQKQGVDEMSQLWRHIVRSDAEVCENATRGRPYNTYNVRREWLVNVTAMAKMHL